MIINLENKVAIVTGASKGIGLATAKQLAKHGATVILAARNKTALDQQTNIIQNSGYKAHSIQCDVSDYSSVQNAVTYCAKTFGRLDILVNNAGSIDPIARLADSDPKIWSDTIDINLKGVYFGLRTAIPLMQDQGYGTIINVSSGAANSAIEGWSHYCSSKAGAQRLTECAHKEVGHLGIRVVGLSPGTVATDMMEKIKDSGINPISQLEWSSHISPEWPAKAIVFLCGPEGDRFAGTDFSIKTKESRDLVGLQ